MQSNKAALQLILLLKGCNFSVLVSELSSMSAVITCCLGDLTGEMCGSAHRFQLVPHFS